MSIFNIALTVLTIVITGIIILGIILVFATWFFGVVERIMEKLGRI